MQEEVEIVRIPIKPGSASAFVAELEAARKGYLDPRACRQVTAYVAEAGDEVAVVLVWDTPQAHAQMLASAHAGEFFKMVGNHAAGAPDVRKYRPIPMQAK